MKTFVVKIRSDGVNYIYVTTAKTKEEALSKVEEIKEIKRDPYGRNWVEEIKVDVHFIVACPIPDPYVG